MKAIVILSGGQDSATCLYWAKNKFPEVEAITFFYGQNHEVEIECAKNICVQENIKHIIVNLEFLPLLVESALTSGGNVNEMNTKNLPSSFVPNRNALFITLAHAYAQKVGALYLVAGVCETDFSGYPDCRQEFITLMEDTLNIGSASAIQIFTPLMNLNKAQTFTMAKNLGKLNEVIDLTNTCYIGNRTIKHEWGYGCGECPACKLREKGFNEFMKIE